jgi:hypothetical protein
LSVDVHGCRWRVSLSWSLSGQDRLCPWMTCLFRQSRSKRDTRASTATFCQHQTRIRQDRDRGPGMQPHAYPKRERRLDRRESGASAADSREKEGAVRKTRTNTTRNGRTGRLAALATAALASAMVMPGLQAWAQNVPPAPGVPSSGQDVPAAPSVPSSGQDVPAAPGVPSAPKVQRLSVPTGAHSSSSSSPDPVPSDSDTVHSGR